MDTTRGLPCLDPRSSLPSTASTAQKIDPERLLNMPLVVEWRMRSSDRPRVDEARVVEIILHLAPFRL